MVGLAVVGATVGDPVGAAVDGDAVGLSVGARVGASNGCISCMYASPRAWIAAPVAVWSACPQRSIDSVGSTSMSNSLRSGCDEPLFGCR